MKPEELKAALSRATYQMADISWGARSQEKRPEEIARALREMAQSLQLLAKRIDPHHFAVESDSIG